MSETKRDQFKQLARVHAERRIMKAKCQAPGCTSPARRWYGWNGNALTEGAPVKLIKAKLCAPCSRRLGAKLGSIRRVVPLSTIEAP